MKKGRQSLENLRMIATMKTSRVTGRTKEKPLKWTVITWVQNRSLTVGQIYNCMKICTYNIKISYKLPTEHGFQTQDVKTSYSFLFVGNNLCKIHSMRVCCNCLKDIHNSTKSIFSWGIFSYKGYLKKDTEVGICGKLDQQSLFIISGPQVSNILL